MKTASKFILGVSLGMFLFACEGTTEETTTDEAMTEETAEEAGPSGKYTLDNTESKLMWEGNMLKVGGVSIYGHNGTIDFEKGMMTMEDGKITDGTFVVDMSTITPTDENYGEENPKEKLVGHLSSPDFFAVDSFPTATFKVTGMDGNTIMGDMTIRGITHSETIDGVTMETMDGKVTAKGAMTLDRQKYNVEWDNPAEDKVLSDDLDLEFNIVAMKDEAM